MVRPSRCQRAVMDAGVQHLPLFGHDQPIELRHWTVVDSQGYATHVLLEQVETDVALDGDLFVFRDPQFYPELRR